MAESNTSTATREFFTYSSVFADLAACAKKHDPELFTRTAGALDMLPALTLRGLSYLGWASAQLDDVDPDHHRSTIANQTIAELTSLVAVFLDFQNEAENLSSFADVRLVKSA